MTSSSLSNPEAGMSPGAPLTPTVHRGLGPDGGRGLVAHLLLVALATGAILYPAAASAQAPRVTWKLPADPSFDPVTQGMDLVDDGTTGGDATAGDGLWTTEVTFPADVGARTWEYVIIPPGGAIGDALGASDGSPMQLAFPDGAAYTVQIRWATARDPAEPLTASCADVDTVLACKGYDPIPSLSDDFNAAPTTAWVAAGEHQVELGGVAWDETDVAARLRDDGSGGDLAAGDGIYSLELTTAQGYDGTERWQVTRASGWGLKLGPGGWGFDGVESPWGGFPLDAPVGSRVRFELRPERGMARQVAVLDPGALLFSELVPAGDAPFIELHNPGPGPLPLDEVYLGDSSVYVIHGGSPVAVDPGEFVVGFPLGASVAAGGRATVSLVDAATFEATWGQPPDYVLSALPPAWSGSVNAPALDPMGEALALYTLASGASLVEELDLLVWGAPLAGEEAPDKSSTTVGLESYGPDSVRVNLQPALATGGLPLDPSSGLPIEALVRWDVTEGDEREGADFNGVLDAETGLRDDETDEPLETTWAFAATPSPGSASSDYRFLVTGVVTASDDAEPLEDVTLTASPGGATAITDGSGSYSLLLPEGTFELTLTGIGLDDLVHEVTVGPNQLDEAIVMDRTPTVTLRGWVERSLDELRLPGASLTLTTPEGLSISDTSNPDGTFELRRVPESDEYTLTTTLNGYLTDVRTIQVTTTDLNGLVVPLAPIVSGVDVAGRVFDAATDAPIAGATLQLHPDGGGPTAETLSGADGTFIFTLVPEGDYELTADAAGYAPVSGLRFEVTEGTLEVDGVPVAELAVPMTETGSAVSLSGKVLVSGLAIPISGAEVALLSESAVEYVAVASQQGDYTLSGLPAGSYALTVSAPGWQPHVEDPYPLTANTTADFSLERAPGQGFTIEGVIQLQDADDWGGSTLTLEQDGAVVATALTAMDGTFVFGDRQPGVYRLTASRPGYVSASLQLGIAAHTSQSFVLVPDTRPETTTGGCWGWLGLGGSEDEEGDADESESADPAMLPLGMLLVSCLRRRRTRVG